jgi:Tol biopolymer transport system component
MVGACFGAGVAVGQPKERIVMLGGGPTNIGLFLANADGSHEQSLSASLAVDYDPAFSRDGNWIVFTSDRSGSADIYRMHPDGIGLQRLTDSIAFNDQGVLSPDGGSLAFVSTREGGHANVWLLTLATNHARNLTQSDSGNFRPSWSPDGKWIAFTSDRNTPHTRSGPDPSPPQGSGCCGWELVQSTALYIVHPDGSGLRRLTPVNQFAGSPKWSADSRHIVYYADETNDRSSQIISIDIASGARQIHTTGSGVKLSPQYLNADEVAYLIRVGEKTALTGTSGWRSSPGDIWNPSWSPNGKTVVYAKPLATPGPTPPVVRATGVDPRFDFYRTSAMVAYSPNAESLVSVSGGHVLTASGNDGSAAKSLYANQQASITFPKWSPDGAHIAFALGKLFARNPVTPTQLAVIGSDGSGFRTITHGDNSSGFPSFSSDGKKLVYRVLGKERGLRILSLADGSVTTLTTAWDNFPAWSPRGDSIVFTGLRSGDFEIYSIRPDGSGLQQLTHDHGNDAHPIWSPDGGSILFTSSRAGWRDESMLAYAMGSRSSQSYGELFAMRADGTGMRQLTDNQWEESTSAWLPPSVIRTTANDGLALDAYAEGLRTQHPSRRIVASRPNPDR